MVNHAHITSVADALRTVANPYNEAWICITGFRQSPLQLTGVELLHRQLRKHATAERTVPWPFEWDADWSAVAEFLRRNSVAHPIVKVFAYSWGAGWGFVHLAAALDRYNIRIAHAVLCDPVYRSPWLPASIPLNPLSLMSWPTIRVPANVDHVTWFYQRRRKPCGHRPISDRPGVVSDGVQISGVDHCSIDESPEFLSAALDIAMKGVRP